MADVDLNLDLHLIAADHDEWLGLNRNLAQWRWPQKSNVTHYSHPLVTLPPPPEASTINQWRLLLATFTRLSGHSCPRVSWGGKKASSIQHPWDTMFRTHSHWATGVCLWMWHPIVPRGTLCLFSGGKREIWGFGRALWEGEQPIWVTLPLLSSLLWSWTAHHTPSPFPDPYSELLMCMLGPCDTNDTHACRPTC